jgi:hypothetical protein
MRYAEATWASFAAMIDTTYDPSGDCWGARVAAR